MENINWLAVLVATIAGFVSGAIWYQQKVFGTAWMKELGLKEEELQQGNMAKTMGLAAIAYLIVALNLALFIGGGDIFRGVSTGFHIGLGAVGMMIAIFYLFEQRSLKIFFINAGYAVVAFVLMGAIIGWL